MHNAGMQDPDILAVIAETRSSVQFETPADLRTALGDVLWAYVPTTAERDVANDAMISAMASVQVRASADGDMVSMIIAAEVQKKGRTARLLALLARCIHYKDGETLRPVGAEAIAAANSSDVSGLAYGLEQAQAAIDPPIEAMTQADYDSVVDFVKKNASPAQTDGKLKSIDINRLRRFLLATVGGRSPSGTVKSSGSGRPKKPSGKRKKRKDRPNR